MQPGSDLLLDDGKLRLKVVRAGANFLDTKVVIGGEISSNKGVNVLDTILNRPVLTDKDRKDCEFAIQLGCDFIALSFVQSPEDVESLRRLTKGRIHIMTKMEKPSAIERMQEIIAVFRCGDGGTRRFGCGAASRRSSHSAKASDQCVS